MATPNFHEARSLPRSRPPGKCKRKLLKPVCDETAPCIAHREFAARASRKSLVKNLLFKRPHSSYYDTTKQRNSPQRELHCCTCALRCQMALCLIPYCRRVSMCRSLSSYIVFVVTERHLISQLKCRWNPGGTQSLSGPRERSRYFLEGVHVSPGMHQTHRALMKQRAEMP